MRVSRSEQECAGVSINRDGVSAKINMTITVIRVQRQLMDKNYRTDDVGKANVVS